MPKIVGDDRYFQTFPRWKREFTEMGGRSGECNSRNKIEVEPWAVSMASFEESRARVAVK
jgi:hypothetical protein